MPLAPRYFPISAAYLKMRRKGRVLLVNSRQFFLIRPFRMRNFRLPAHYAAVILANPPRAGWRIFAPARKDGYKFLRPSARPFIVTALCL